MDRKLSRFRPIQHPARYASIAFLPVYMPPTSVFFDALLAGGIFGEVSWDQFNRKTRLLIVSISIPAS
jgi:hypothetical protein